MYMYYFSGVWNDPAVQNIILRDIGSDETVTIGTQTIPQVNHVTPFCVFLHNHIKLSVRVTCKCPPIAS